MNCTTTTAQRTGSQPSRVVAVAPSIRPRCGSATPMPEYAMPIAAVPMADVRAHSWQGTGLARFDATNGALGTSTKCPSRPLGPRTT